MNTTSLTKLHHQMVAVTEERDRLAAELAKMRAAVVKDSLTAQADCRACVNRGRINGLSQETYCESCVYEGRNWRKNHFIDAAADRLLEGGE